VHVDAYAPLADNRRNQRRILFLTLPTRSSTGHMLIPWAEKGASSASSRSVSAGSSQSHVDIDHLN
jgi:hypothetical protein